MSKETKDLAPAGAAQFPALSQDPARIMEVIRENLGGDSLSAWDLDRITIPAGGGLAWSVPSLDGVKPEQFLLGVIVYVQNARAYWKQTFDASGGGNPPDCVSEDAVTGVGDPGGECRKCPYAAFGSGRDGRGQACKQIRRLFMLRQDEILPMVVNLPPTSLKNSKDYLLRLASHGVSMSAIVTRIGLAQDKANGITYSKAVFAKVGNLTEQQAKAAGGWKDMLAATAQRVSPEDFVNGDGDGI